MTQCPYSYVVDEKEACRMSTTVKPRIAFIGLGVMGLPMAGNLQRAGFAVAAHDVSDAACQAASGNGLEVNRDLADALSHADVVITMLPNTAHVEAIVHSESGTLAYCRPGTVHVDMSSISPVETREFAIESQAAKLGYIDAPVSGGVKGARSGTLSIMAGGELSDLERVTPVLQAMSSRITHMGDVGTGQATKACNQVAVAINIQAVCEAFALGSSLGVDLNKLREALMGGSTASWVLDNLGPQMIDGDDSAGFRIGLQVKDLRIALEAAHDCQTPLPAASGVLDMYLEAVAHGEGDNGNQALSRVYERLTTAMIAQDKS